MKKLLILATLLLVLVVAVVACTETPAGPGEESTVEATQEPATDAPTEEPTQAPTEAPTDAPTEEPTDAPTEEPTDAPVTEEPTEEPTEAPTEPPVDPNAPLHTVAPDFLANYAAQTGNMVCCNDLGTTESLTEAGRTFFRLTSAGGDPYIAFIDGSKNLKVGRYMAISYRTNSAKVGQFFMGSGQGWTGNGDQFLQDWNEDGNWNLAIIDLDNVGLTALTDYVLNYARLDFFTEAGAEGDYFDVEYIGFFSSAEAAEKYNFEMHKAPMWDADKSVIAHQSFDQFYYGNGSHDEAALDENLTLYHAANRPDWDFVADMEGKDHEYLTYWGWVATKSETIGQFGYQFNGGTPVYDAAWTHATEQPVIDAAKQLGGVNGSRMKIFIPVAGLAEGENSLRILYKDAEGNEVCLNEIIVKMPVVNLQNKFESDVNANTDGDDLQISDLSQYFTITYGASDPHVVSGGLYQYGGINEMYADVDGFYAYVLDMQEACNTALAFVRGTRVVHSVDLPEMDVPAGLYPINNYYETDGNGLMGGAGIYAAIYNGRLNILVKAYDDASRTHIANKQYSVKCDGTELTIADNGETVYFMVDGKLLATVALSGSTTYEKICDVAEGVTFAQTAVVTLADGTTDTVENTLVVSTHKSQLGIAVRPGVMKFSSIKVLGFNDVTIPGEFYVPEVKENIALNKPVDADSVENEQNVPYKMTDGDESTRWGALPNGVANVIVDLEAVYTLSGMDILFENAGWGYEIALSTDGETYTKIYEAAGHGGKMVSLEGTVDARYIKFTRTQDDGATHYWFSIYELYVYGTLKGGEPIGPEAPETIVIDPRDLPAGSITGHMPNIVDSAETYPNHYGMIAAAGLTSGAMLHQGSIYIGDYDLTNCTKVVIYYATDWGQGTQDALAAAKEQGFGCIGICAWDNNNVVNPDRNGFVGTQYTPDGGWAITAHEIDVTELAYAGPVYVSADFLGGQFIIIDRVELVGATKMEPTTPEEPAKGELIHTSNDELRIMGTDNMTQIGQAFEPGKFDGWNKVLTLEEGSFGGLIDWGWVAVNSTAYEFGYIINGAEIFSPLFNGPADPNVDAVIANLGANNGGRFLGMCAAQALIVGENNVKFAVKLDGGVTAIIREYTVIVNPKVAPHEHSYEAAVTAPTCTVAGFTTYTCACGESYVADEVAALGHNYVDGVCSVCGEADPDYVAPTPAPEMPAEFCLSLYQGNVGKTLYFNGQMSGNFIAMSTNPADAVKMYSEKVEGGYRMYFLVDGVKNYLEIYEYQTGKKGVHITTEPAPTYYEWSDDANTWITWLEGCNDYAYLGTYNTFETISSSWISYITGDNAANVGVTQFVAQWGEMPEVEDHEHSYETVVTAPTCTEGGYTTYTCACGDTYKGDEVAALGHNYVDGVCSVCGEAEVVGPEAPANAIDFATFYDESQKADNYLERVNADGWTAISAQLVNNKAVTEGAYALILNGKTSAIGSITSPTLAGGISKISFNCAYVFSEANDISLKITITGEDGTVVTTDAVIASPAKDTLYAYEYVLETPITGNFSISIVNNAPTQSTKNKDRCAIWGLSWEGAEATEPEVPAAGSSYDNPIVLSPSETNTIVADIAAGYGNGVYVSIAVPATGKINFVTASENLDVAEVYENWDGSLYTDWECNDSLYDYAYGDSTYVFLIATKDSAAEVITVEITFEAYPPELYYEGGIYVEGSAIEIYPSPAYTQAGAWVAIFAANAEMTAENALASYIVDDGYVLAVDELPAGQYVVALMTADNAVSDTVEFTVAVKPVTHVSFDQLYAGSGTAGLEGNLFTPGQFDGWDGIANVEGLTEITAWGWTGLIGEIGQFGYCIDGDTWNIVYDDAFTHVTEQPVINAALGVPGTTTASRFKIVIPVVAGTHTVDLYYKTPDGLEVSFASFTMTSPVPGDSVDNPIYVTEEITWLDMEAFQVAYYYVKNPVGMALTIDWADGMSVEYNGTVYTPDEYGNIQIIFTEDIGAGAAFAITASNWGNFTSMTIAEYVAPSEGTSDLVDGDNVITASPQGTDLTYIATATGTVTFNCEDSNCWIGIVDAYGAEWMDWPYSFEVVEGEAYTLTFMNYASWTESADYTITITNSGAEGGSESDTPAQGTSDLVNGDNVVTVSPQGTALTYIATATGTVTFNCEDSNCWIGIVDANGAEWMDWPYSIEVVEGEAYTLTFMNMASWTESAEYTITITNSAA